MNSRRSFLRMLGLSTVAAPVAVKAIQAEAAPVSAIAVNDGPWRLLAAAQREINRRYAVAAIRANQDAVAQAEYEAFMEGEQWTPQQTARMERRG